MSKTKSLLSRFVIYFVGLFCLGFLCILQYSLVLINTYEYYEICYNKIKKALMFSFFFKLVNGFGLNLQWFASECGGGVYLSSGHY